MEGMTDAQFDILYDLIVQTVKDSKTIEEAVKKLQELKNKGLTK